MIYTLCWTPTASSLESYYYTCSKNIKGLNFQTLQKIIFFAIISKIFYQLPYIFTKMFIAM